MRKDEGVKNREVRRKKDKREGWKEGEKNERAGRREKRTRAWVGTR